MHIPRIASQKIVDLLTQFPVVTVLGPRQSGKTTLVQSLLPQVPYYNLEDLLTRQFAEEDPYGFLAQMPEGGIIDEIQRVPALLSLIQVIVDKKKKNGMFVLSGSQQFLLMHNIIQSLAGRTAIFQLLPLSLEELALAGLIDPQRQAYTYFIKKGFYPKVHAENTNEYDYYSSYYQTYVERDLRDLIVIQDLTLFRKFVVLCAGRVGQLLNKESLGRDVGVSASTVEHWLSVLEASFVTFRLPPFYQNLGKRLIKSPKLYFYDVGLACYLLNMDSLDQIASHPLRGNLFENMIVLEVLKYRTHRGLYPSLTFYRDSNGNEVDLVFERGGQVSLMEIKSAQTYLPDFYKGMEFFEKNKPVLNNLIVYGGQETQKRTQFTLAPWYGVHEALKSWQEPNP